MNEQRPRRRQPGIHDRGASVNKRYRYQARFRASGSQREISQCFATKQAAQDWLAQQRVSRNNGAWIDPARGKTRFDPFARRWLALKKHEIKPSTHESYRSLLESRVLPAFKGWQLAAIQPSDVREWLGEMTDEGLSASRRRKCLVVLRLILDAAVTDRLLLHNAARDVKAPTLVHVEAAYFDPAVVGRVAESAGPGQYRLLVLMLGRLGFRFGEAVGLERRHVDLLRGRIKVEQSASEVAGQLVLGATKTYAVRVVPVPPSLVEDLREHLDSRVGPTPDAPLFTGPRGGRVRHANFYGRVWRPALRSTGVPTVGLHVLRHSAAAALIASGANVKAVSSILGHRSVGFTLTTYGHLFDDDLDAVARDLDSFTTRNGAGMADAPQTRSSALRLA